MNISLSCCWGVYCWGEDCHNRALWEIYPLRSGLTVHMLRMCVCFRKFIYFDLSNTTLKKKKGTIDYLASFHHRLTAEVWTEGTFSVSELCEQMFCAFLSASVHTFLCLCNRRQDQEQNRASFGWLVKECVGSDPTTCWKYNRPFWKVFHLQQQRRSS